MMKEFRTMNYYTNIYYYNTLLFIINEQVPIYFLS